MKNKFTKTLLVLFTLLFNFSVSAQSPFVGLSLETVDNSSGTFTGGEVTYRLYAELNSPSAKILQIQGDETRPHLIETTTTFYQDAAAADLQNQVNSLFNTGGLYAAMFPDVPFDSWVTIGDNYSPVTNVATLGDLNWSSFAISAWSFGGTPSSDASIFRVPTDAECLPDANNKILLGQFTTTGVLSGYINLAGLNPDGSAWSESNIPIPQSQISTGVNENQINDLNIYPNPSKDMFNIEFTSSSRQSLEVRIINIIGEVVYTKNLEQFVGEYNKQVDLATYTKGVYFLEIETDNGVINKKLILQ